MEVNLVNTGSLKLFTGNGELLFSSAKTVKNPISTKALTVAVRAMGFTKDELHVHGLRYMASTILNERGCYRDWIERQLSHGDKYKIRSTYNNAEYLPQRYKMMQYLLD